MDDFCKEKMILWTHCRWLPYFVKHSLFGSAPDIEM